MKTLSSILSSDQLKFVEDISPAEINLRLISGSSKGAVVVACSEMAIESKFPADRDLPYYIWQNLGGCIDDSTGLGAVVLNKGVNDVIVFGHTDCGIIEAGLCDSHSEHFSAQVYDQLCSRTKETRQAAKERFGEKFDREIQVKAAKDFVIRQLASLLSIEEVSERAQSGLLRIHAWILNGDKVESFNPATREFCVLNNFWS